MPVDTVSQLPLSPEAIKEHEGRWVCVVDGEVVAAADSIKDLVEDERVKRAEDTKALYHVPRASTLYYWVGAQPL